MLLSTRVINSGRHPPLLTRDDLLTIIRVEDQFGRRQICRLLTDLHHIERQPLSVIAEEIDVPIDTLQRWMYWLHIKELEIALEVLEPELEEVQPAVPFSEEPRQSPFEGIGVGIVVMRIVSAWNVHQSWVEVAKVMKVSLDKLSEWANHRRGNFAGHISSEDMSWLLEKQLAATQKKVSVKQPSVQPEVSKPAASSGHYKHLSGIILTQEVREAIKQCCIERGCTEKELFTDRYDPARIADISSEIGIGAMVYLKLVKYYRGTIAQTVGGQ
jgi:hypothetical protein